MIAPADLERWSQALLEASGLESAAAQTVAVSLVHANRRGTDSHGVARLPTYSQRLRDGHMNRNPAPKVERDDGAVALVDGDQGPGQVAGVFATDLSIDLARRCGAGVVVAHRSSHYGAAGYYAIRAAEAGMVGMSTTNSEPYVVPYGGIGHALGTNPIALAAPLPDGIWDTDMATSQVAVNKIFNARDEGRTIPEGWGVDSEGRTTTDPNEVYAAVPLGGYKGYALAVLVEVLSGVLSGSGVGHGIGRLYEDPHPQDVGHFHLAIDIDRLTGRERGAELLARLLGDLKAIPPAPGHDEVLVPGEPEQRAQAERERDGIPLPPTLWASLEELSAELGVTAPTSG
ncbi:MAG TPA: Ldh family oxidoreductase [Solirubrobacteraceae bacterium]|nr:Ldh family oxidoreductase [Solirubrobacteraceae bacterium]